MAETIQRVDYYYIYTPDKPGEGARALAALKEARVNLLAFSGFPQGRRAQLVFVPASADSAAFMAAAKKAKWKVSKKKSAFLIQGDDRAGALVDIVGKLAAAKINVTATDAVCAGMGRFGAILWVKAASVKKAAKVLGVAETAPPSTAPPSTMPEMGGDAGYKRW